MKFASAPAYLQGGHGSRSRPAKHRPYRKPLLTHLGQAAPGAMVGPLRL